MEKYHLKNQLDEAIKILYDNSWLSHDGNGNQFRMLNITNFVQELINEVMKVLT